MRPAYHYAPAANWLSDPNGLVHHRGEWHLFYQYNPYGEEWGHMSWGHAVSADLCTWDELPVALAADQNHAVFSGSAVIDQAGTAGFGATAMVAIYTEASGSGGEHWQTQCLASSTDHGRTWTRFPGNPVLDLSLADFRDPNVFWHAPSRRWIMVVALSTQQQAVIYGSRDLIHWEELSVISGEAAPGAIWECPLLIELPVAGSWQRRWLFKVDALEGGPGSGALYQIGTFDGARFEPDRLSEESIWQVADHGADFYAAIAWHEPRDAAGRPVWIGWMGNHAYQRHLPKQGWRGAMSAPRRLSLKQREGRLVLSQEIELAVKRLVLEIEPGAATVPAVGRIALPQEWRALTLIDQVGRRLELRRCEAGLLVDRADPVTPELDTLRQLACAPGEIFTLWLDHGSAELLSDCGCRALTVQHRLSGPGWDARWA